MGRGRTILRILLHGFFLMSLNLFSIIVSIVLFRSVSIAEGGLMHSAVLLLINVSVYLLVLLLIRNMKSDVMDIDDFSMLAITLMISMALLPLFYHPLYFLVRGYWSSLGNLVLVWTFQIVANGLCLVLNHFWLNKNG